MSILHRVPRAELGTRYTHRGWMWFCPIYIGALDTDCPDVCERNWVPAWVFDLAAGIEHAMLWVMAAIDPDFEPAFAFYFTDRLPPPQ